ncbi:MFS transporter [Faunimonas sp. B44]|uniref:MFS transporter n=1 Tax=Faunimonas sp. B44 TaxID=3461493 RepID=UPI0040449C53
MTMGPPAPSETAPRTLSYGWVIVAVSFLSMALVLGSRFSLGLFLPYMPEALGTTAAAVSGAIAVSMLAAAAMQPLAGILLDRLGGKTVLAIGLAFSGLALCGTAFATELWQLTLLMGLVSSVGYAAVSPVSVASIVSRWFDRNRGVALGVATSGTKVSMIVLPPSIAALIVAFDWRIGMLTVGVLVMALIPAVLIFVRPAPSPGIGAQPTVVEEAAIADDDRTGSPAVPSADVTLAAALRAPAFWLIAISLFANGLIMNLVFVHLPGFVLSEGYDAALAATGLTLVGGIGILGNVVTGAISDRLGRNSVLLVMFGARAASMLLVVLVPGPTVFLLFITVFGLLGYGAIGVVGALAAGLFGRRAIGAILGSAYVFNQLGAAAGVFIGGVSLEWTGSFHPALWVAIATTAVAVLCVGFIRDGEPVAAAR